MLPTSAALSTIQPRQWVVALSQKDSRNFKIQCDFNPEAVTAADITKKTRRGLLLSSSLLVLMAAPFGQSALAQPKFEFMEGIKDKDYGKTRFRYSDFELRDSGLQLQDIAQGTGDRVVKEGDKILIDWDGYTIGYYGRPFEAKNKAKGGAFGKEDKDYLQVKVGVHEVIPGVEEALYGMREGGIRRLIVPVELGYPNNDFNVVGPKPTTFSGQRALSFVLKNTDLIDKTMLFDIKVVRILS